MADLIGIPPRSYQRLEHGCCDIKLTLLQQISGKIDVPIASLISPPLEFQKVFTKFSTTSELDEFNRIGKHAAKDNRDCKWVIELLRIDREEMRKKNIGHVSRIEGLNAYFSSEFAEMYGVESGMCDFQPHLVSSSAVQNWEAAFRQNVSSAIIQNILKFPIGVRVFEEHHHFINANPENPYSDCTFWDVTANHELEKWIESVTNLRAQGLSL